MNVAFTLMVADNGQTTCAMVRDNDGLIKRVLDKSLSDLLELLVNNLKFAEQVNGFLTLLVVKNLAVMLQLIQIIDFLKIIAEE